MILHGQISWFTLFAKLYLNTFFEELKESVDWGRGRKAEEMCIEHTQGIKFHSLKLFHRWNFSINIKQNVFSPFSSLRGGDILRLNQMCELNLDNVISHSADGISWYIKEGYGEHHLTTNYSHTLGLKVPQDPY